MNKATSRFLPTMFVIALFAVLAQWTMTQPLQAQDDAPAEDGGEQTTGDAEESAAQAAQGKSLIEMFQAGGLAMYPLALLSISGFGLIIYNFMAVKPGPILKPDVTPEIDEAVRNLDLDKARNVCNENPGPVTNILGAGLARADLDNYDSENIKEALEESSSEELAGPYVLINYLSVIGSLSPMVGLLGTVSGMVKAFNVIEAEGAGSAQQLAGNISEALITTATGMIIGIPTMFFFFYFKNRYGKITSRVSRVVGDIQFALDSAVKAR